MVVVMRHSLIFGRTGHVSAVPEVGPKKGMFFDDSPAEHLNSPFSLFDHVRAKVPCTSVQSARLGSEGRRNVTASI